MTVDLLPYGQTDDAAERYLATLNPRSAVNAKSQLEMVVRWLLDLPDAPRVGRAAFGGARRLHLALDRVPWSGVTADDARRVRVLALGGPRSARTAAGMLGALRGVLRAAGALTVAHLDVLRVDGQASNGRTVASVVAGWDADEAADQTGDCDCGAMSTALHVLHR